MKERLLLVIQKGRKGVLYNPDLKNPWKYSVSSGCTRLSPSLAVTVIPI